jgi:glycosyltransferase involved in cell wall biosynthesis
LKTVFILSPGFPKNEQDTTCLPTVQQFVLAANVTYPDLCFVVLSFQYPFVNVPYLWNGIQVIPFGGKNKKNLHRIFLWYKVFWKLRLLNKNNDMVGILSLWGNECALLGKYFGKVYKIKNLTWLHGQDAKKNNRYIKYIAPKSSELIAISDFIKNEFYANHRILPFLTVENGITKSIFPEFNSGLRPVDVFGAGNLIPLKNYSLFIDLINELMPAFPNINVVIAGVGNEKELLEKKIELYQLQNNVRLIGLISHNDVLHLMNKSKIFLHTSKYEGNSAVLIEALYSGCKVVTTCPLSERAIENMYVETNRAMLLEGLLKLLSQKQPEAKRVLFNSIDDSAKRIINLFLQ